MQPSVNWREKIEKKAALENMLWKFFGGTCIVDYAFKVTANDFS